MHDPDKKPRLSSMSFVKHKDHMMKSTLMAPKWTREWGLRRSSTAFPEWWDNLPPTVQNTARQQHHLCSWGYSHQSGTELLPTHGPSPPRYSPLASVLYTDMKPLVNSYIQKLVQTKWDVAVHGRDLLSCETNTGATEEVPAPNHSWRGCNHPTSNWPYQGHEIPYLVPRTANWLSPLWSNTDHWPYAAGVCIVTGMLWWILHSRLVECSLRDISWDLHSRVPARSGILLSDKM